MPDVLLIQPPVRDFYLTRKRTVPYGLTCMASVLLRDGYSVEIFDALATTRSRPAQRPAEMEYLECYYGAKDLSPFGLFHQYQHFGYSFEHIGNIAKNSGASLIGISSLFTPYSADALMTAQAVKAVHPDCKIALGGHHPTAMPCHVMAHRAVDFVLRGEGECSLSFLAGALRTGSGLESIPGIVFRKAGGGLHVNPPAAMENLDAYPLPAIHLVDRGFYRRRKKGCAVVVTSRGCPGRCTYCSVGSAGVAPFRKRCVESVISEMDLAVSQYGTGFIDFEDENLSVDRSWFLRLLGIISDRFHHANIELRAMNGLLPSTLDDEVVGAMKKAGFKTLNLSLGSTSENQLRRFKRQDVREAFDSALNSAEKYGLDSVGYVIAGAPDQRATDSVDDLIYLARRRVLVGLSVFYPAPGSEDFLRCRSLNLLPDTFSLMRSTAFPISHTTSRLECVTLFRLARILNFMKFLVDNRLKFPEAGMPSEKMENMDDRVENGKQLIRWLYHDGRIRGLASDGRVFEHETAEDLVSRFLHGFETGDIAGSHVGKKNNVDAGL